MPATGHVDAVILPLSHFRKGASSAQRIHNLLDHAEPFLGGQGYIRNQGDHVFITKDPNDTIFFPDGHSLARSPRYEWAKQPDGSSHGTLLPDPDAEEAAT